MKSKSCGLCFEQILNGTFENLELEKMQNILSLLNLDIVDVKQNKEATVCSICADISLRLYNFRTACLNTNDPLKSLEHHRAEELTLEETIVKDAKSKTKCENGKVCRFCLKYLEENSITEVKMEEDTDVKDMLMKCVPELDVNIVKGTCICYKCIESLEKCCSFILRCEDNELVKFLRKKTKQVTVDSNKKTNLSICNAEDDVYNSFMKKEENCTQIEEPELQINDTEKLTDGASKESLNETLVESNCHSDERDDVILGTHCDGSATKPFSCTLCDYRTNQISSLRNHIQFHQKHPADKLYSCDKCNFVTKWRSPMYIHRALHMNPSEGKYKCSECSFKTDYRKLLSRHLREHKLEGEYKCTECQYESNEKVLLQIHYRSKHKKYVQIETVTFNCRQCEYTGKSAEDVEKHKLVHVTIIKCEQCGFKARCKSRLKRHMKRHKTFEKVREIFKCNDCDFNTKYKCSISNHVKVHRKWK